MQCFIIVPAVAEALKIKRSFKNMKPTSIIIIAAALIIVESVKKSVVRRPEPETVGTNRGRRPQDRC